MNRNLANMPIGPLNGGRPAVCGATDLAAKEAEEIVALTEEDVDEMRESAASWASKSQSVMMTRKAERERHENQHCRKSTPGLAAFAGVCR